MDASLPPPPSDVCSVRCAARPSVPPHRRQLARLLGRGVRVPPHLHRRRRRHLRLPPQSRQDRRTRGTKQPSAHSSYFLVLFSFHRLTPQNMQARNAFFYPVVLRTHWSSTILTRFLSKQLLPKDLITMSSMSFTRPQQHCSVVGPSVPPSRPHPNPLPHNTRPSSSHPYLPRQLLWWADTLGLAAFCVIGAQPGPRPNPPVCFRLV